MIVLASLSTGYAGKSVTLILVNYETRNDKLILHTQIGTDGKSTLNISEKEPQIYDLGVDNNSLV